jgi:hypothetical protein
MLSNHLDKSLDLLNLRLKTSFRVHHSVAHCLPYFCLKLKPLGVLRIVYVCFRAILFLQMRLSASSIEMGFLT